MAVAAMAVVGSIWTTQAQHVRVFDGVTFAAVVPGQAIRLSVGNTAESATNRFVYMYYTVSNPSGVPLYESGRIQVPPREFRFSDVSRPDLNTEGEPGTGRAQVMVRVTIEVPAGSNPEDIPCSLEVVDERTGSSVYRFTGWAHFE